MLNCKKCKFGSPFNGHYSCSSAKATVTDVSAHGIANGWFTFPLDFDPMWADKCNSFVEKGMEEPTHFVYTGTSIKEDYAKELAKFENAVKQNPFRMVNVFHKTVFDKMLRPLVLSLYVNKELNLKNDVSEDELLDALKLAWNFISDNSNIGGLYHAN